jgi:2-polyprenyl-6-methoxyphenol hydroxylase-like FAD-dependent oxidoreductase
VAVDTTGADTTTCCIVGCGPAGAMLGLLLARSGVDVVVLEKYPDFFRDFRGDTIHASTLQVLDELGLLPAFERLPQQKVTKVRVVTDTGTVTLGDFTALPGRFQYISLVPQWDFLTFVTTEAARYPGFRLRREAEAFAVVEEDGVVRGVRYRTADGIREVRALLTVACDGRRSAVRREAGLRAVEFGAPMDALWYRVPREDSDPTGMFGRLAPGRLFPMLDRHTYWQGAYVMPKGSFPQLKAQGIGALHAELRRYLPFLGDRVETITGWDDVGFLEVRVNRLERWYREGLLCLGDAAHAMSPIGGVGINLAIQDAVAAANLLTAPLRAGRVTARHLAAVQRRRERPTVLTQRLQLLMQRRMISPILASKGSTRIPLPLRLLMRVPVLRRFGPRVLARFLAVGFRPEHVRTSPIHNGLVGTPPAMGAL